VSFQPSASNTGQISSFSVSASFGFLRFRMAFRRLSISAWTETRRASSRAFQASESLIPSSKYSRVNNPPRSIVPPKERFRTPELSVVELTLFHNHPRLTVRPPPNGHLPMNRPTGQLPACRTASSTERTATGRSTRLSGQRNLILWRARRLSLDQPPLERAVAELSIRLLLRSFLFP
jgi:hypothetical protein